MLTWVGRFQCFLTMKTPTKTPISSAKPPSIHRLSASRALLPSAAASSPKILAKQSCKHTDKEGQSLNCSDFSYTIKECVYFVIHPSRRAIWWDDILMGTADRISRVDIDLSYLIVFRWKTSEDPGKRTELILILFLLLRGKKMLRHFKGCDLPCDFRLWGIQINNKKYFMLSILQECTDLAQ